MAQSGEPGAANPPHTHDILEITYVNCDICNYYLDGELYKLRHHDLLVVDSSIPHRVQWIAPAPRPLYGIAIGSADRPEGSLSTEELLSGSPVISRFFDGFRGIAVLHNAEAVFAALRELASQFWDEEDPGYQGVLMHKLFLDIAVFHEASQDIASLYVCRMKVYMEERYREIHSLEEVAASAGIEKSHAQRLFRRETGTTIWQYLTSVRLRQAARILRETDDPLSEVEERVGIRSRQNFYQIFRKSFGVSPQDFRRTMNLPGASPKEF